MSALARSFRHDPKRLIIAALARRTLFEVALENAVEGCVRETYGAAVGAWQARRAPDDRVRRAFAPVVADEARHADLAWDVHAMDDEPPRLVRACRD